MLTQESFTTHNLNDRHVSCTSEPDHNAEKGIAETVTNIVKRKPLFLTVCQYCEPAVTPFIGKQNLTSVGQCTNVILLWCVSSTAFCIAVDPQGTSGKILLCLRTPFR